MDSSGDSDDGRPRGGLGLGAVLGAGGRRKRRRTEESILGVFADTGGDSDGAPQRKKGGGKGGSRAAKSSLNAPLSFVKGETQKTTQLQPSQPTQEDGAASDEEIDSRFRFTGAPEPLEPVEQGPKPQARNSLSFGQMAASYGKGFVMLKKMGFEGGGLGRNNDGIANPIEVVKRKERMGLQDDGEMMGQDLYGHDQMGSKRSVEDLLAPKPKKDTGPKASEGWKKDAKARRPKTVYKTAAEVAQEAKEQQGTMRIIDMRGPEVRVAASFSELAEGLIGDNVRSLKELRYNARVLVADCQDKIRKLAEQKRHAQELLLVAVRDSKDLEAASGVQGDAKSCRELVAEMEALREKQDEGSLALRELGRSLRQLRSRRPAEFRALRALDAGVALAAPIARKEFAYWNPLKMPDEGLSQMVPWIQVAEEEKENGGAQALEALCDVALLPRLRAHLAEWSARDYDHCIRLVESCQKAMPSIADMLVDQVVLLRLQAEVDAWDPRTDVVGVHMWIHPWLPVLGSKLDCLWDPIRLKISACLDRWEPRDLSAHGIIKPWKQVFRPAQWEPLIEKVLVRLERGIAEMPIRPDGQDVKPVQDMLLWADIVPVAGLARVLEVALFPHWLAALRAWLRAPECDYQEVLQWYGAWKSLLEPLREQRVVQKQMALGLSVMKHFMAGGTAEDAPGGDLPERPDTPQARRPAQEADEAARSVPAAEEVSLSLVDYLAEVAAEHGLIFRPKQSQHGGKQIYQLGSVSVYLDNSMVHVAPKDNNGEWQPMPIDDVLRRAAPPAKSAARRPQRRRPS